jgi:hypothetical protein
VSSGERCFSKARRNLGKKKNKKEEEKAGKAVVCLRGQFGG